MTVDPALKQRAVDIVTELLTARRTQGTDGYHDAVLRVIDDIDHTGDPLAQHILLGIVVRILTDLAGVAVDNYAHTTHRDDWPATIGAVRARLLR